MQVSPFSFPPAFIGVGYGVPAPGMGPIATDPRKEYVAGGYGFLERNIPQVLPWMVDDVTREFGPEVYEAMDTDAVVGGTFRLWKMSVLSSDVRVQPAVRPDPERRGAAGREGWTADEVLAREIADFCRRSLERCRTPFKTVLSQMLDAARRGHTLAEKIVEDGTGPDAGRLVLKDLKCKPRWSWLFVADVFLSLVGILAFDPQEGGFVIVPEDKFLRVTWQMRDNDPRGTSLYRQPYRPWNVKQNLYPEYYKHLTQFAGPSVVGFVDPGQAGLSYPQVDDRGNPVPDAPMITAEQAMGEALQRWRNGSWAAFPPGAKVQVEWPQGNGEPFLRAFEFLNREIAYGILGSTRDSMEAEHGSKADSGTAQDKTGNQVRAGRECLEAAVNRDVLKWLVTLNWGDEVAERLTPRLDLGQVEHHDVVALMSAVAQLVKAGGVDMASQGAGIHAMLELPPAAPGAFEGCDHAEGDDGGDDKDPEDGDGAEKEAA